MNNASLPDNVLVSMSSLLDMRYQARSVFHKTYKKSSASMAGNYSSPFRGRGIDFSEVRLYEAGDDVRNIDWRVTARTGKPHTKLFVEERERPVFFVLDCGPGMQFGTQGAFKSVVAANCAALLAWSAAQHGDRVGSLLFAGDVHEEIRPTGGKRGVLKLFRQIIALNAKQLSDTGPLTPHSYTDVLYRLKRIARPGSLIYLISDFSQLKTEDFPLVSQVAQHCDMALIHVYDILEKQAPPPGRYKITDGTHEGVVFIDAKQFPRALVQEFQHTLKKLETLHRQYGIHYFSVTAADDVVAVVRENLTHKMLNAL